MGDFKGGFVEAEKAMLFPTKRHEQSANQTMSSESDYVFHNELRR